MKFNHPRYYGLLIIFIIAFIEVKNYLDIEPNLFMYMIPSLIACLLSFDRGESEY